ncbi:NAD(P)/FAD-dependent oxidoreductase [Dyadobacter frigoris]|uniref:NAD(P)/FAD-dependent oxidoreductase n=1 Tax=Dyadobacter frigoris TaxID=2576211 RepID=A0A4U6CWB5_9BACT|nr:NAD(P)/FAD-dependent oxidoreductase [Dyadobacter frigoris]TKT87987.1 NAD(P)/FAD-dependent oxidoreductase [Dyadobacter frigoris]GLU52886.1 hypothetical protein Dfri01_23470 [Dyadobacter frigoris]
MMIRTDLCIIGSGPVALFAVFEAGQLNMRCHLINSQFEHQRLTDLEDKQLSEFLLDKIGVFQPSFSADEWVENIEQDENGNFTVITNKRTEICCKSLVIAGNVEKERN